MCQTGEFNTQNLRGWIVVKQRWFPRMVRRPTEVRSTNFNAFIDDPDGSVEEPENEANSEIRHGEVKKFTSAKDLIDGLNRPW